MDAERFHVAVLDVRLDESDEDNEDGLLLMEDLHRKWPSTAVIILTGYGTVDDGAKSPPTQSRRRHMDRFGFLQKSEFDRLPECVEMALEQVLRPEKDAVIGNLISQGENQQTEFKTCNALGLQDPGLSTSLSGKQSLRQSPGC